MNPNAKNIWCVGRNYADHAKELGNAVPQSPLIFLKSGSTIVHAGKTVGWPSQLGAIHHEVELAIQFDAQLKASHFGVALDLTARDRQAELKSQGHPWTLAKSFINSTLLGALQPLQSLSQLQETGQIYLEVNGRRAQHGLFSSMIFPVEQLIDYVKSVFPVEPGDLLLTGTPSGVGPLSAGDEISAWINDLPKQTWRVGSATNTRS